MLFKLFLGISLVMWTYSEVFGPYPFTFSNAATDIILLDNGLKMFVAIDTPAIEIYENNGVNFTLV